jgi:dolichol-phosphate mannosyltransferase
MSGSIVREALLKVTQWGAVHRWNQLTGPLRRKPKH